MSWDILIQDLPRDVQNVADIPDDYQPRPLGARDAVIARLHEVLPEVDFSDPTWGIFDGPGFSIEFNMGTEEICDNFMLHVRGGGRVVETISKLLEHLRLRGVDCQTGDFFTIDAAQDSFRRWQAYRDHVMDKSVQVGQSEVELCPDCKVRMVRGLRPVSPTTVQEVTWCPKCKKEIIGSIRPGIIEAD
jgi:hypothetical protein